MTRRAKGHGSVYQRKDGKWIATLEITDGRARRRRVKRVRATQKAANAALLDLQLKATRTGQVRSSSLTVDAWLTQWLSSPSAQRRPSTQRSYAQTVRDHIRPYLQHRPLASLTVPLLQRWLDDLVDDGRTPHVVRMARAVLRAALTHAVRFGHLDRNPALSLVPPRTKTRKIQTATADHLDRLAKGGPPWFATWLFVTVALGLRRGESLGLQWDDLDWRTGTLTIARAVLEHGVIGLPKTESGRRTYVVPPVVAGALLHHRRRVELLAMAGQRPVGPWIFGTASNRPLGPRNLSRAFYAARKAAKLTTGLRIHDLRHTAGTMLLNAGTDPKTIAGWLGHADVQTTLRIYTQSTPDLHLVAGQKMQRALPDPGSR